MPLDVADQRSSAPTPASPTFTPSAPPSTASALASVRFAPGGLAFIRGGDLWVAPFTVERPSAETRLTVSGEVSYPKWSASGQFLAVVSGGMLQLFAADGEASSLGLVDRPGNFAWSPATDELAYSAGGSLWLASIDAGRFGTLRNLVPKQPNTRLNVVVWSPDGSLIAYGLDEDQGNMGPRTSGYRTVDRAGRGDRGVQVAVPANGQVNLAGWLAGDHILYWQSLAYGASIWADGAPLYDQTAVRIAPVTLANQEVIAPRPRHPGEIAVVVGSGRENWTGKSLFIAKLPGEAAPFPGAAPGSVAQPAWSSDGVRIAYVAAPDDRRVSGGQEAHDLLLQRRIYVQDVDRGTAPEKIVDDPAYRDEWPVWQTGADRILFARLSARDEASLWLWDGVADGRVRPLVAGLGTPTQGGWFGYYGHSDWAALFAWWQPRP